ncbi:DUF3995 domain-containing protein [Paenibacillus allorhizosphaerae]|uniref:DUF3995 domain-containing protein n=1 Tax=Paenibacillus allorhizosphaerae TaxID=2849866 RepID=A0ABN7TLN0_9BACL|nr:DUF3995 domain-containing protein [Paenibacillus allorhizosphaerae]CAG7636955.1 hypothetical protein PAECIP111802_02305 [Paenibacillus allorhizosphaerae]
MSKMTMNDTPSSQILNAFERFTKTSAWPAYAGCFWALMYAVFVRFYEAVDGFIGGFGQPDDPESFSMASYIAGVVILLCGFVLIGLVKPWGKVVPVWVPLIGGRKIQRLVILVPTLLCTAFLIAHGLTGMITKALLLAGVITINLPGWIVDTNRFALWDLLFYEPWFLIMGILSGLTAAHYAHASDAPLSAFRRSTVLYLIVILLLTMFLTSSIVFDFVDKISF